VKYMIDTHVLLWFYGADPALGVKNRVSELPFHHRDPFDRILAAQSLVEDIPMISADESFDRYGVNRIF